MSFNRTRRASNRTRTLAAAGLLAATALFLTACSPDNPAKSTSAASGSSTASETSADSGTGATPGAGGDATTDSSGDSDASTPGSSDTSTETPAAAPEATTDTSGTNTGTGSTKATVDNRVDGTVTGTLTFLAPGKLEVGGRPFYVAVDTDIRGGDICGDPESQSAEKCTADELDAAAKGGNLTVEVTIKKGIAERVAQA